MPGEHTLTFCDATFTTDIMGSAIPVMVDVWADGCGGCKRLAPLIDLLAGEYVGRAKVGKLNAMSNSITAAKYNIRGLPTVLRVQSRECGGAKTGPG